MPKKINLIGHRFGRLTVLCEYSKRVDDKKKSIQWVCQCDCGNEVIVQGRSLREGHAQSCGCMLRSVNSMSKSRVYKIWFGMKERCRNERNSRYEFYGAKGITYCKRWEDFNNFWEDMHEGYSDKLTLDRIDFKGNYSKENCRWVDIKAQQNNKCSNVLYEYRGKTKTISQWAEEYGMNYQTLHTRLAVQKLDIKTALMKPLRKWKTKGE